MRRGLAILVVLCAFADAGAATARRLPCGVPSQSRTPAPWPAMRHDLHNTGLGTVPAVYHGDAPWSFTTGAGLFITPVVSGNGLVYFGSADHNFYALNPQGKLCWQLGTGNIIDAAAALDNSQRTVTIGSADENLYHLSAAPAARRRVLWRYHATLPPVPGQLVDWWEDDIAYGPDGNLYTGNTGGVIYSFTPDGRLRWTFRGAGNSVWTMPSFGPGGVTYWGSVDRNVYALDSAGQKQWSTPTLGFVISSPAIGSDGTIYIGSFDSKLYGLDPSTGLPKWTFGTNDHIYSSPALAHDAAGNTSEIYIASTDAPSTPLTRAGSSSGPTTPASRSAPRRSSAPRRRERTGTSSTSVPRMARSTPWTPTPASADGRSTPSPAIRSFAIATSSTAPPRSARPVSTSAARTVICGTCPTTTACTIPTSAATPTPARHTRRT